MRRNVLLLLTGLLISAAARADDLLVDPMSSTTSWALSGQRINYVLGESRLDAVKEPARPGAAGVLRLTYDLDRRQWIGILWEGQPIVGRVQALGFWLHGDASRHLLSARVEDAAGRPFDVRLTAIDFQGWRRIELPMDTAKWTAIRRQGDESLPVRWPITLREIRVNRTQAQPLHGSVFFSELRAQSQVQPIDRLAIRLACDAPAQVFYAPESIVLRATFQNPASTALEGRVESVLSDWLGHERLVEHGPLTLAPGAQVERELRIPAAELGAYEAWVRFRAGAGLREAVGHVAVSRRVAGPARLEPDSPFGMGLYLPRFGRDEQLALALTLAREAGVKWARDGLNFAHLAPSAGRYAWEEPRRVPGPSGGAIEFAAGEYLTVPSSASLNRPCVTGEITLAFRLRFGTFDYPDRWRILFGKGEGPERQFHVYLDISARKLGISFGDGRRAWSDTLCAKSDWKPGTWYQVLVAHRRADRSVRWWVDGSLAGEGKTWTTTTPVANDLPLLIGGSLDYALDDLAVYDRALAPGDLAAAASVAHWTFDEGPGPRAADSSGNGNHAWLKPLHQDTIFAQAAQAGISTYATLMGVPAWMASKPAQGVERPWNLMPRLDAWSTAVEAAVGRYARQGIHTWEIWNEPNIEPFWSPRPDPAEYAQVLSAAYAAIKKADPQATVLGCALAGPHGPQFRPPYEFIEQVLKHGGGRSMDAVSIHPYRQGTPEDSAYLADLRAISDLTARYGRRLPLWITEIGWPNDPHGCSESWSAQMLARAYLLAIGAGVKNVAWYDYHDDGEDPSYNEHHFGLLRHDLTPKPAYFAFRTMATELSGMQFQREIAAGDGLSVLLFAGGGRRTAVAWSHRGERPVALRPGRPGDLECLDLMGNTQRRPIGDGAVLLTLSGAPIFLRDVSETLEAVIPVACSPPVLKLLGDQPGRFAVTLRNPFDRPLELSGAGQTVSLPARGTKTVALELATGTAAGWKAPLWRTADGSLALETAARAVALAGRQEPIFARAELIEQHTLVPDSAALSATDEVTIACQFRSTGPSDTWQVPVAKWGQDQTRNYGLYLGREKGELFFSASFAKGPAQFTDISSGVPLFDGRWHRIAVAYSKHDAEICFYVDGALAHRQTFDGGDLKPVDAPLALANGFVNTADGRRETVAAVRAIRVWNRALGPGELAAEAGK